MNMLHSGIAVVGGSLHRSIMLTYAYLKYVKVVIMFKKFALSFQKGRTVSALQSLSDRQLADIGITRKEIHDHVERIYA